MAAAELTELETAIEKIATVFVSHAGRAGRGGTLTAAELGELLRHELPGLAKDAPSLDARMRELDGGSGGELGFGEYWRLLGELVGDRRRGKAGKKK
ncbi:protein S100-A13 [Dromaius novaehollandiae]|nr:protein S100-A13 [Dromaius novaehollandiae]